MPELPEVETIRRHLAPHVEGRVLPSWTWKTRAGASRSPGELRDAVEGRASSASAAAASTSSGSWPTRSSC